MSALARQACRYVGLGGANTFATGLLLAGLAHVMDPRIAYTLVFLLGLALASALTGRFVFSVRATRHQRLSLASWYSIVYLTGLGVVQLLGSRTVGPTVLAILTVLVTAPLGFLGGRLIFARSDQDLDETGHDR